MTDVKHRTSDLVLRARRIPVLRRLTFPQRPDRLAIGRMLDLSRPSVQAVGYSGLSFDSPQPLLSRSHTAAIRSREGILPMSGRRPLRTARRARIGCIGDQQHSTHEGPDYAGYGGEEALALGERNRRWQSEAVKRPTPVGAMARRTPPRLTRNSGANAISTGQVFGLPPGLFHGREHGQRAEHGAIADDRAGDHLARLVQVEHQQLLRPHPRKLCPRTVAQRADSD